VRDVGEQDTLVYLSKLEDVHGIHSDQLVTSALSIKDSEGRTLFHSFYLFVSFLFFLSIY